jgi:hypothetical protein
MQEVKKRENFKIVNAAERKWKITKLDAMTAAYIGYKIVMQAVPMGLEQMLKLPATNRQNLALMSMQDFKELITLCLGACYELQAVNGSELPVKAVLDSGAYGVQGLEDDTKLLITLVFNVIMFNLTGFFGESALKGMSERLPADMFPANAKT